MNYLYIQWNNYLYIQRNIYSMKGLYIYSTKERNIYIYIYIQIIYVFKEIAIYIFSEIWSTQYKLGNWNLVFILYGFQRKANEKPYTCCSAIPMATKCGRVVTCSGGTPTSKSCDLLIMWSLDKCKNLYLHFRNIYSHQTWHSSNLRSGDPIFKVMWTFEYVIIWEMKKTCIYTYTIPMATKLGRVVNYIGGIPSTTSCNLLILWSCEKWKTL